MFKNTFDDYVILFLNNTFIYPNGILRNHKQKMKYFELFWEIWVLF